MATPWKEVAASKAYRSLSSEDQEAARNQYFDEVVAPHVDNEDFAAVRKMFDDDTKPTILSRAKDIAGDAIDYVKDAVAPAARPEAPDIAEQAERGERPTLPGYGIKPPEQEPVRPDGSIHEARRAEQLIDLLVKRRYLETKQGPDYYAEQGASPKMIENVAKQREEGLAKINAEIERVKAIPTFASDESFLDVAKRNVGDRPSSLLPFTAAFQSGARVEELRRAVSAINENDATDADREYVKQYMEYSKILSKTDKTLGGEIADILSHLPAFAGELITTGGLYTAAKIPILKTVEKYGGKAARKYAEKKYPWPDSRRPAGRWRAIHRRRPRADRRGYLQQYIEALQNLGR